VGGISLKMLIVKIPAVKILDAKKFAVGKLAVWKKYPSSACRERL
jgi:hypothetical protein